MIETKIKGAIALLVAVLSTSYVGCKLELPDEMDGNGGESYTNYGAFGGAFGSTVSGGGASNGVMPTSCDGELFNNGNVYACTTPTSQSSFTLSATSRVTSLRLWVDTSISGQSITYQLENSVGTLVVGGSAVKGSCDPYQTQWCEFLVTNLNTTLAAGTYTVVSSAVATCSNSGTEGNGMVTVKGCKAASTSVAAGGSSAVGSTTVSPSKGGSSASGSSIVSGACANPGPLCQELAICCAKITDAPAAKADCEKWANQCEESSCSIVLHSSLNAAYCRE